MAHFRSARRNLTILAAASAVALGTPVRVRAQTATFKSGVDLVPLTVTVTDKSGKYVTGLTGSDFTVLEDGVEQPVSFFACGEVPVDVALVIDTSASMRPDLPIVQTAASGLVRTLRDSDRGAVVEVKDTPGLPQPFTSDRAQIERSIRALRTSGATALYDGLYVALKEFERERRTTLQVRRQVLVLLSDGLDTKSRLAFEDVMDLERRVGVNIYVIALPNGETSLPRNLRENATMEAEFTMGAVARESGGRTFFPKDARELLAIYAAIAQELASQYDLGYSPVRPGGDGAFRRVAVRVPPNTNGLARTRSGYYAPRTAQSLITNH